MKDENYQSFSNEAQKLLTKDEFVYPDDALKLGKFIQVREMINYFDKLKEATTQPNLSEKQ